MGLFSKRNKVAVKLVYSCTVDPNKKYVSFENGKISNIELPKMGALGGIPMETLQAILTSFYTNMQRAGISFNDDKMVDRGVNLPGQITLYQTILYPVSGGKVEFAHTQGESWIDISGSLSGLTQRDFMQTVIQPTINELKSTGINISAKE